MPTIIDRAEVRRMVAGDRAQLIEVLPREEYESEHITGARSLPLKELNRITAQTIDPELPVIVYCDDFQ